jgi:hypothetical protein
MSMPEAPVNEDRLLSSRQNYIRAARQILSMKSKTVISRRQGSPDNELWPGVLGFDGLHNAPPLLWRTGIDHMANIGWLRLGSHWI